MAEIVIKRKQSVEEVAGAVSDVLLGKKIDNLKLFFEGPSYKNIEAVDISGIGETSFFEKVHNEPNFSGSVHLLLTLQSKGFFSISQPRISIIINANDGLIQKIGKVQWFSK